MEASASGFIERIMNPNLSPPWWQGLLGEVRQGRPPGRYLNHELERELQLGIPNYRSDPRGLNFFGHQGRSIDGRVGSLGVEEKHADLSFEKIIDGAIHRGIVWTLANPQGLNREAVSALGVYVVREGSSPLEMDLAKALFPILTTLAQHKIFMLFVRAETGQHWSSKEHGPQDPVPSWLAEEPSLSQLQLSPHRSDLDLSVSSVPQVPKTVTHRFKGGTISVQLSNLGTGESVAVSSNGNEWRVIEIGLLLRAMGYSAVRVSYRGKAVGPGGRGVEGRVRDSMLRLFGVSLDWGVVV